jgi:hypothetical protein
MLRPWHVRKSSRRIWERTIASGHAQLRVALPVLSAAPRQQLMPDEQALDDALNAVRRVDARAF